MNSLGEIAAALEGARSVLLFLHILPDGDSVGSNLALAMALERLGISATMIGVDPVPGMYSYLPGAGRVVPPARAGDRFDLAVFLDCTDPERAGEAGALARRARQVLNIDHHVTNRLFGDLNYVDPEASAVGEIVYDLLQLLGVRLDTPMAECLYAAIMTDTGSFRYENTTSRTHHVVADLIAAGANPSLAAREIYENRPWSSIRLLASALGNLRRSPCGRVAWISIDREMYERSGAAEEDSEGIVNYARCIQGVEVGLLFREWPDGRVKVGLRSKRRIDVSALASSLGGGGHPRAAGCILDGPLARAEEQVLGAVLAAFEEDGGQ